MNLSQTNFGHSKPHKIPTGLIASGIAGLLVLIIIFSSFVIVDEGHVGIVERWSKAVEEVEPGLHFKVPFADKIKQIEVRTRRFVVSMPAATNEQMRLETEASLNWTVLKGSALDLYVQYGGLEQFEQRIIRPRILSATKGGIPQFSAEQLIQNRQLATDKVKEILVKKLQNLPIKMDGFQLEQIQLPKAYTDSITVKQTELNLAAAEQHKLTRQGYTAQQMVNTANATRDSEKAKADGNAYKIRAEAEAEAYAITQKGEAEAAVIRLKSQAVQASKGLAEYERAIRWNGELPRTFMGEDQSVIWSMEQAR